MDREQRDAIATGIGELISAVPTCVFHLEHSAKVRAGKRGDSAVLGKLPRGAMVSVLSCFAGAKCACHRLCYKPTPVTDPAPLDALSAPALSHAASLQDARAERRGLLADVQGQAGEAARRDRAAGGLQVEDRLQPRRRAGFSGWGGGGATRRLDQRVHKGQPAGAALDGVTHLRLPARPGCVLYCNVR